MALVIVAFAAGLSAVPAAADYTYDPPATPTFLDVDDDHGFYTEIEWLADKGITSGYTDGTFRPGDVVTRGEFAAWLHRLGTYTHDDTVDGFTPPANPSFSDVGTSHPFRMEIEWLVAQGITSGYTDGTFRPGDEVHRDAMAAFLHRYAGEPEFPEPSNPSFGDVPATHAFYTHIEWLHHRGIADGNVAGDYEPGADVSRQEGAKFLFGFSRYFGTRRLTGECLARTEITTLSGTYTTQWKATSSFPEDGAIDARAADWATTHDYPFYVTGGAGPDVCVVGGYISNTESHATTTWGEWKVGAGFITKSAETKAVLVELDNVGDGFRFGAGGTEDWELRGVKVTRAHDDCVENDKMHSGLIDDSFFNGCYVFYSSRTGGALLDGSDETVTVSNSLVWLEPMPHVFKPAENPSPGHGPMWKMGNGSNGIGPQLAIHNSIFRIDQDAVHGDLGMPGYDHDGDTGTPQVSYLDPANCSKNVIVWTGSGAIPTEVQDYEDDYPDCFTITTDIDVWNDAVDTWEAAHDI